MDDFYGFRLFRCSLRFRSLHVGARGTQTFQMSAPMRFTAHVKYCFQLVAAGKYIIPTLFRSERNHHFSQATATGKNFIPNGEGYCWVIGISGKGIRVINGRSFQAAAIGKRIVPNTGNIFGKGHSRQIRAAGKGFGAILRSRLLKRTVPYRWLNPCTELFRVIRRKP